MQTHTHTYTLQIFMRHLLLHLSTRTHTCTHAHRLRILVEPYGFKTTDLISVQPVVAITDIGGNVIARASSTITARVIGDFDASSLSGAHTSVHARCAPCFQRCFCFWVPVVDGFLKTINKQNSAQIWRLIYVLVYTCIYTHIYVLCVYIHTRSLAPSLSGHLCVS